MQRQLVLLLAVSLGACSGAARRQVPDGVHTGLDVMAQEGFRRLTGLRVGVIANHTSRDKHGRHVVELLDHAPGVNLVKVFSPEHGFAGKSEEWAVGPGTLKLVSGKTVPLISLYGGGVRGMRPKPEDLADLDALLFDMQDIGTRFYTYLATMAMALEEAKRAGIPFFVLDRPNPVRGDWVEGPLLSDRNLRLIVPTAYFPVPIRHGLTAGEMALLHNQEVGHPQLHVVAMRGWRRAMWYDETGLPWIAPSPNMPDLDAAALYPGVAPLEFTNLSVGRGTPIPFRFIGAPWMDAAAVAGRLNAALLDGIRFETAEFTPTKSTHQGVPCPGVRITVTDREAFRPLRLFAHLVETLRDTQKDFDLTWPRSRHLIASDEFKRLYDAGAPASAFIQLFETESERFAQERRPYLLYK